ncbi:hypothetical protein FRB95_011467 [Tulasnella sp. JGI-2019a]|nr:hypothetical protein FRB95_011467 [Tulasnella sp. JGI-2019a]
MLFAFGRKPESFFAEHGRERKWQALPNALDDFLKEQRVLRTLSMGEDGAWFYRELPRWDGNGKYCVSSATDRAYPGVKHLYDRKELIEWIAFGRPGHFLLVTETYAHTSERDSHMVRTYEKDDQIFQVPIRCASFGYEGSWVVVEEDGEVRSWGVSEFVEEELHRQPVRRVELSHFDPSAFFIEYTDGTTTWSLPAAWQSTVQMVQKMPIQEEVFPIQRYSLDDSTSSNSQHVAFAFGPLHNQYAIASGLRYASRGISDNMSEHLRRPGTKSALALGEGGAWFWKSGSAYTLSGATRASYPDVWKISKSGEHINWVSFGPNGYYIVCCKTRMYASRAGTLLRLNPLDRNEIPLRTASFGYGGAWVIVEQNGSVRSHALALETRNRLREKPVRFVQLSQVHPRHYFIEYMDGKTRWFLPTEWQEYVEKVMLASHEPGGYENHDRRASLGR